ncbi:hypothetical protein ACFO3O_21320 [Dokdonia ponticola]|uniref:Type II secretion system protein GspC N-terminal domain-containing protein n=1 Tax=Dokdonia ponticola TaxID=2041041 RepID=A0ABV9I227_9FLAO
MNKKKRTKYLLLAVILIYGAVIVRFFMLSDDGVNTVVISEPIGSFKPTSYTVKESFTIDNNYRDPFLGTLTKRNQASIKNTSRKKEAKEEDTYYPTIRYLGLISDAGSGKKVLSLEINAKEYIAKEGSVVDSVQIISGNLKSISVSYKGKRKTINISG